MRSLTARLLLTALACIAAGGGAYYLLDLEGRAAERRDAMATFDRTAKRVMVSLSGARAAQFAYVAEGQGVAIWQSTVAAAVAATPGEMDALRALARTAEARAMLIEASARVRSFSDVDRRAIDYLRAGDTFMAGDLVFTEGAPAIAAAIDLVNSAWRHEVDSMATLAAAQRLNATYVATGVGVVLILVLLLLAMTPGNSAAVIMVEEATNADQATGPLDLHMRESQPSSDTPDQVTAQDVVSPSATPTESRDTIAQPPGAAPTSVMMTAAEICLALGAVRDDARLRELLGRAASLMEAPGIIVWVGNAAGADLQPTVAHGYSPQALSRIAAVPRTAENAVAAAYRTATLQAVGAQGHGHLGAVIAPLVTPDGCVGALSVEVPSGREESEVVRALALLFAAQLAALLAADAESIAAADVRAASA